MAVFSEIAGLIPTVGGQLGEGCDLPEMQQILRRMPDAELLETLQEAAAAMRQMDQIQLVAAGHIAARSGRSAGHRGLAQSRGHSSAANLVQSVTGSTRNEAWRLVRVGSQMIIGGSDAEGDDGFEENGPAVDGPGEDGAPSGDGHSGDGVSGEHGGANADGLNGGDSGAGPHSSDDGVSGGADGMPETGPGAGREAGPSEEHRPFDWRSPLRAALRRGELSQAQFDAIQSGLGEPPKRDVARDAEDEKRRAAAASDHAFREAWFHAAEQLVLEAGERTVEELRAAARTMRDLLDPEGAEDRFRARYERRAFRTWVDHDGQRRASMAFDDEGGAFIAAVEAAAMRPRRGGPRFIDSEERAAAERLIDDPRTNDQLAYDLFMDLLRSGACADAKVVFGTRQAGVRLVQSVDSSGQRGPIVLTEDHLISMPKSVADQRLCDTGFTPVTVDSCGNPLDVGREERLFTPKQRIALAIRDGGCRWQGCDRPASYCEAHHIDEWAGGGRTDIDRGILLCRFHHMQLHHGGWRITRDGVSDFVLHDSSGGEHQMRGRTVLRYLWAGVDPPPRRFPAAA